MKEFSIVSMVILALILTLFVALVPKYPDLKSFDLRNGKITELTGEKVSEK